MVSQRSGWRRRTHFARHHGGFCLCGEADGRYARATERRIALRYEERAG